jgi:uncharacterized protein (DUF697 family)/tellurite resistance protein
MNAAETRATLTIALMAAFADGLKDERERAAVKRVAEALDPAADFDLPGLYRDVLLAKPDLGQVAAALQSQETRQFAYEMAVGVCDADGAQNPAEREFLQKLAATLRLDHSAAAAASDAAEAVARAALGSEPSAEASTAASTTADESGNARGIVTGRATLSDAEMDKLILNASITNAALELLPESLASVAIIPLQVRLVYRIGKSFGYPMDASNARDFIATLGVGLTGQYLEQFGRKLLGGILGGIGGGLGRGLGRQAASSGMSFATTYAMGRIAQRYYADGRTMDGAMLKQAFTALLEEARGLAPGYRSQIEQKADSIDVKNLISLVRQS